MDSIVLAFAEIVIVVDVGKYLGCVCETVTGILIRILVISKEEGLCT